MEAQPFDPSSFFQDTPPPSWSSPEWKWGSEDGAAHAEAEKTRAEFAKQFRRSSLLSWAKLGSADYVELRMVGLGVGVAEAISSSRAAHRPSGAS